LRESGASEKKSQSDYDNKIALPRGLRKLAMKSFHDESLPVCEVARTVFEGESPQFGHRGREADGD